jgi:SH3-like domain-containing protein
VRDADGAEGWVLHSLLSGKRTAQVEPWAREPSTAHAMFADAAADAAVIARVQAGVVVNVDSCDESWCRVAVGKIRGYIRQNLLWGVYPNEQVD